MAPRPDLNNRRRPRRQAVPADVIFGRNAVVEAARAGRTRRILISSSAEDDPRLSELRRLGAAAADPAAVEAIAGDGRHQGVVAELLPRRYLSLRQMLALAPTLLVAADSVLDPGNLGAIIRSAEAAGAGGLLVPERRSAPISGTVVKASSGATEHLPLCRVPGLASAVPEIRRAGIWCAALHPHGEMAPWEFDLRQPVCLVVGGEGAGVHRLVMERCDVRLRLPMTGRVESLNAAAAATAVLFEIVRQRSGVPS